VVVVAVPLLARSGGGDTASITVRYTGVYCGAVVQDCFAERAYHVSSAAAYSSR
jgi:vacuolar-type H+-ATPase catalytic subunit A/Vma1